MFYDTLKNIYVSFSQNGVVTLCSSKETLDNSILANSMNPNRDSQSTTNGLITPQSPKPVVPDICIKTGHKFSNLLPMLGYCEQCSVRVFVGLFYAILIKIMLPSYLWIIVFYINFIFVGVKCKVCKFRYHKGCLSRVPLNCTKSAASDDGDPTHDGLCKIILNLTFTIIIYYTFLFLQN